MDSRSISTSLTWKLLEGFGVQGAQFVLQLFLARLLDPEHYGVLSLMVIFTTLANVFIQNGFNTSLIQNKDVVEEDYSSVFWVSFGVAVALYILLFFAAPWIAAFYEMPEIVAPFRVLSLILLPGSFHSVQLANVSRAMDFKQIFYSNIGGVIASGIVGVAIAYQGGGIWALVAQTLLHVFIACIVMFFRVKWRPKMAFNRKRVAVLFRFGWKLLVSGLIETLYQDFRSLVIGKKYDSGTLGYYNRGKQFPQFLISAINSAVQSVMLPAMAREQDDKSQIKAVMRNSIILSAYSIFPMMAGLAGVAKPLVTLLLTEKWLPCAPFLQVYCLHFAFYPVHTCNLQAINAIGRSDIFLKLEIIKKAIGLTALVVALVFFDSPISIAITGAATSLISCFVNAYPNKKLIDYAYFEQVRDILPSLSASLLMLTGVFGVGTLDFGIPLTLALQILAGVALYLGISVVMKLEAFTLMQNLAAQLLDKHKTHGGNKI